MLGEPLYDHIRHLVERDFYIHEESVPEEDFYYFIVEPVGEPSIAGEKLYSELSSFGYIMSLRKRKDGFYDLVVTKEPPRRKPSYMIHIVLFILTFFSTLYVGAIYAGYNPLQNFIYIFKGLPFSISLLTILGVHELGHYTLSKMHRVDASLPYFIPFPTLVGTMGAFIMIRSHFPTRKSLFDVGIAGPLAGIIAAIPVTILGLHLSKVVPIKTTSGLFLGDNLIFTFLTRIVKGHIGEGYTILLHPVAFAGWIGFFVTALNLLPIGQLDGGHIAYAVFHKYHRWISLGTFFVLIILSKFWLGWLVWAFLAMFLGYRHPVPLIEVVGLDNKRKYLAVLAAFILIVTFIPSPFSMR